MENNNKEPIVLGELKKEKSSKPFFAIIVFVLVLGVCFGLPYIKSYISSDFSLSDLLNKVVNNGSNKTSTTTTTTTTTKPAEESTTTTTTTTTKVADLDIVPLNENTILNSQTFNINSIGINNNILIYTIETNESINFDQEFFYIEIYNESKSLLGKVRIKGTVENGTDKRTESLNFFADSNSYYLRLINSAT